jgi:hypothetical protein
MGLWDLVLTLKMNFNWKVTAFNHYLKTKSHKRLCGVVTLCENLQVRYSRNAPKIVVFLKSVSYSPVTSRRMVKFAPDIYIANF